MAAGGGSKELNPDASILGPRASRLARGPDLSQLRPPIKTSVSGTRQVIHALETATGDVKKVLLDEINLMYECKTCQSVFRSLANLISHKRTFCKAKYSEVLHMYQDKEGSNAANMQTVVIEAEPVESKKCRWVVRLVDTPVDEQVCRNVVKNVCNPEKKTVTVNVQKSKLEKQCRLVPKEDCRNVQVPFKDHVCTSELKKACKDVTRDVCRDEPVTKCRDVTENVPKEVCRPVTREECRQVPKVECHDVLKPVCVKEPSRVAKTVCKSIPREVCLDTVEQQCQDITTNVCTGGPTAPCINQQKCEDIYWCKICSQK